MYGRITALRVGYLTSSHQLAVLNFPIARLAEKQLACFEFARFYQLLWLISPLFVSTFQFVTSSKDALASRKAQCPAKHRPL